MNKGPLNLTKNVHYKPKDDRCFNLLFFYALFEPLLKATILNRGKDGQGEDVMKPYTPTTLDSDVGYFELVIKVLNSFGGIGKCMEASKIQFHYAVCVVIWG